MKSTSSTHSILGVRPLRVDAKQNRAKLLLAAHDAFSEYGVEASLEEIAKRAGLGIGTLYRHFPTRSEILAAACDERLAALAQKGSAAVATKSPFVALGLFLEHLVADANVYQGLAASLNIVLRHDSPGCRAATATGKALLRRAQAAGEVRGDARFDDLVCMVTAIVLTVPQSTSDLSRTSRLIEIFVQGLRAPLCKPVRKKRPMQLKNMKPAY